MIIKGILLDDIITEEMNNKLFISKTFHKINEKIYFIGNKIKTEKNKDFYSVLEVRKKDNALFINTNIKIAVVNNENEEFISFKNSELNTTDKIEIYNNLFSVMAPEYRGMEILQHIIWDKSIIPFLAQCINEDKCISYSVDIGVLFFT